MVRYITAPPQKVRNKEDLNVSSDDETPHHSEEEDENMTYAGNITRDNFGR